MFQPCPAAWGAVTCLPVDTAGVAAGPNTLRGSGPNRSHALESALTQTGSQRRGLQRIADTLDAVPFVTICNLASLNAAMRGGLLDLIEAQLMCVGGGPTLDYADAAAFLARFETVIEMVRRRRLQ
jgi:hypothetical protein